MVIINKLFKVDSSVLEEEIEEETCVLEDDSKGTTEASDNTTEQNGVAKFLKEIKAKEEDLFFKLLYIIGNYYYESGNEEKSKKVLENLADKTKFKENKNIFLSEIGKIYLDEIKNLKTNSSSINANSTLNELLETLEIKPAENKTAFLINKINQSIKELVPNFMYKNNVFLTNSIDLLLTKETLLCDDVDDKKILSVIDKARKLKKLTIVLEKDIKEKMEKTLNLKMKQLKIKKIDFNTNVVVVNDLTFENGYDKYYDCDIKNFLLFL